jgi:hypothetical protein
VDQGYHTQSLSLEQTDKPTLDSGALHAVVSQSDPASQKTKIITIKNRKVPIATQKPSGVISFSIKTCREKKKQKTVPDHRKRERAN